MLSERFDHALTQTPAAAGNQRHLAIESHIALAYVVIAQYASGFPVCDS
jgi:hypothetical protein